MIDTLLILLESDPARCAALAEHLRASPPAGIEVVSSGAEAETLRSGHPGEDVLVAEMRPHPDSPVLPLAARGVVTMLSDLLQSARPEIEAHTEATVRLTESLAEEFAVPEEFREELRQATRLHAVGCLGGLNRESLVPGSLALFRATARLLRHVEGLGRIAELIEGAGANWDGSGQPQLQRGEIPFRSRLLRVASDVIVASRSQSRDTEGMVAALDELAHRAGTWYDPAVLARLRAIFQAWATDASGGHGARIERLNVDQLQQGMVLATDVTCDSGMTLLRSGQTLTAHVLELLRSRHIADPVVGSIMVHRSADTDEPA